MQQKKRCLNQPHFWLKKKFSEIQIFLKSPCLVHGKCLHWDNTDAIYHSHIIPQYFYVQKTKTLFWAIFSLVQKSFFFLIRLVNLLPAFRLLQRKFWQRDKANAFVHSRYWSPHYIQCCIIKWMSVFYSNWAQLTQHLHDVALLISTNKSKFSLLILSRWKWFYRSIADCDSKPFPSENTIKRFCWKLNFWKFVL